jgi:sterol desaturase/sphingolipid hydroxylase (fatty acid hydroxylase superfamily)
MIGILFFLTPSVLAVPLYFSGHLQLIVDPWATPPLVQVISFVLFIIGADAWFYWTHRAMHHPKLYMATHELHHKAEQPSPLSGYAFSMIEGFVLGMYLPVVLLIVPVNGVVLAIFVQVFAVLEAYVHLGYEILPNGVARHPIGKHLGTSVFHNMHHEDGAFNFGVYFTWWDRLMGTMHPEYEDRYEAVTARRLFAGAVLEGADT